MKLGTVDVKRLSAGGVLAREARLGTQQVYSIFNDPVSALFFRRQTAGGSVLSPALPQYGKALLSTIKGNSMVWNQRVPDGVRDKLREVTTTDQTTISTGAVAGACFTSHKYLFIAYVTTLTASDSVWFWGGDRFVNNLGVLSHARRGWIMSPSSDKTDTSFVVVANRGGGGTTGTAGFEDLQLIDLTLMYGAGNEPSSFADFERDFPLDYYDYNPGQIINLTGQGLETVGFNQWDEEWESGILDDTTGEPIPFSNRWRTKNFIPCLPGTAYYFHNGGSGALYVFEYDSAQNCIKYTTVSNAALTTQAGTHFLKFYVAGYGATYNHDICINISNATKNGTYEPYWKNIKDLGLDSFDVLDGQGNTITIHGLAKAGDVYDEIDLARQKYIKRVGSVDLGTLSYTSVVTTGTELSWRGSVSGIKRATAVNVYPNILCAKYERQTVNKVYTRSTGITVEDSFAIRLYDPTFGSYTGAQVATALSGVTLYFELDTPEEYDLQSPMDAEYRMDYLGTEALIPENSSTPSTAAFSAEIKYPK